MTTVGRGVLSKFELEMVGADPLEEASIVSGSVSEGMIDGGVYQFRLSGERVNIYVVDWYEMDA